METAEKARRMMDLSAMVLMKSGEWGKDSGYMQTFAGILFLSLCKRLQLCCILICKRLQVLVSHTITPAE
jgi:hypothetical protein